MDTFSIGPTVLYFMCCAILGVRLLVKGLRTGDLPELGLGVFFTVGVCVGFLLNSALLVFGWTPPMSGLWLAIAMVAANAGVVALLIFVWRVFRSDDGWAAALFFCFVIALALLTGVRLWTTGLDSVRTGDWVEMTWYGLLAQAFAWTAIECFLFRRRLERRRALGMADPVLVSQFNLWTWAAALQVATFCFILVLLLMGRNPAAPLPSVVIIVMSGLSAPLIWVGVFPPQWLRRRLAEAVPAS